jgi:hypothetical protein
MTFRNCEPGQAIMSVFALIGKLRKKITSILYLGTVSIHGEQR